MRRSVVIGVALLALAVLFVAGPSLLFTSPGDDSIQNDTQPAPETVSVEDSDSEFWRFLSPAERFQERSPLNVVVRGETDDVVRTMSERGDGDWEEVEEEGTANETADGLENRTVLEEEGHHATGIAWGEAQGTTRYAWIEPGDGEDGYWTTETHQLEDGDYYGQRYHIRLYESPNADDEWVAMQAHTEHFDWLTLRHRVDGVEAAQSRVERDFMDNPRIDTEDDVRRIYLENSGPSDADGWATVVDLAGMLLVPAGIGLIARGRARRADRPDGVLEERDATATGSEWSLTDVDRRRLDAARDRLEANHLVLLFAILALYLGVRMAGVALERHVGALTPHMIAALLYPVIAVGIPVASYLIARGLTRRLDAALVAGGSLAVAMWIDYGLLGVDSLPLDVVLQRVLVVVALGLIAGGAAKRAVRESRLNDLLVVGVLMWVLVLAGILFGYL